MIMATKKSKNHFSDQSMFVKNIQDKKKRLRTATIGLQAIESENTGKNTTNSMGDYFVLCQNLNRSQKAELKKYIKMIDTTSGPYGFSAFYSLESEKNILAEAIRRMNVIKNTICQTDAESIATDWIKIGGDLNGAICSYRKHNTKEYS